MKFRNFPTTHCHPQSFDSGSSPEIIAKRESELETGYITVTDHGTLEAARHVYDLTKKKFKNLKPILGLEGYFRDDNCPHLIESGYRPDEKTGFREHIKYHHITMHALDEKAFFAMTRILSSADLRAESHGSERKPLFSWKDLEELGQYNVTMCSSCLIGMCSRHILDHDDFETAERYFKRLTQIVRPGNFYVEIFPHVCDNNFDSATYAFLEDGSKARYRNSKKIKTEAGEIFAQDLAKEFLKNPESARKKHRRILEVKNWRKWEPLENPTPLVEVKKEEGFLKNECRPWSPNGDVQTGVNKFMLKMAEKYGAPVVLADDSHFAYPEEKVVQDIRLAQMGDWRFSNSHHRMTSQEAWEYSEKHLGTDRKTFESWIDNSYQWASRFNDFKFSPRKTLPTSFYPADTLKHTMYLVKKHGRMDWNNPTWRTRLKEELDLLHSNGTVDLLPYFQVVEEVCDLYSRNGQLTGAGRGSAAGLLLSYLLGITHVDPIKHKLSKDRFLTLDRIQSGKYPDIDQDLGSRDLLVNEENPEKGWLKQRFGENVAQISTNNTGRIKMSIKDVFRALYGEVPEEIEVITKKLPTPPQGISDKDFVYGYKGADGWVPGVIETDKTLKEFIAKYPKEWDLTNKVMGLHRSKGRHAAGYVISDEPISNFIPMTTVGGVRCTSYDAKGVEAMGALKMDFLVIDVLRKLQGAIKLIQDRHAPDVDWKSVRPTIDKPIPPGQEVPSTEINGKKVPWFQVVPFEGRFYDIWDLPIDFKVLEDICNGQVETVFQFDAGAARLGLKHFRPKDGKLPLANIDDLATFTALDRPGPLDALVTDEKGNGHNMLVEFARRAAGEKPVGHLPILDNLIPETRGVITFQEQLQRIFQEIGQTTAIEANNFRADIGKKQMAEVVKHGEKFMQGAIQSVGPETAQKLWDMMYTFGQYGFNASHAVSYMYEAYACAWLKHHYSLEWWTSVLSNAKKDDLDSKFWRYIGHKILLPDISRSKLDFEIEGDKIRAPLSLMKGLGEKAHNQILELAPFESPEDLVAKIELWKVRNPRTVNKKVKGTDEKRLCKVAGISAINKTVIRNLAIIGCLDSILPATRPDGLPLDIGDKLTILATAMSTKKKKPDPIPVPAMKPMELYQFKKKLLPAYNQNLSSLLTEQFPGVFAMKGAHLWHLPQKLRIASGHMYLSISALPFVPDNVDIGVVGYVIDHTTINYKKKNDAGESEARQAAKLLMDVDGERLEFVKWPSGGSLPDVVRTPLTGAVVMLTLNRRKDSDSFFLNNIEIVSPPFEPKQQEESKEVTDESEVSP